MNDQRALDDQLDDLERICAERGMYDAQDWLKNTRSSQRQSAAATMKRPLHPVERVRQENSLSGWADIIAEQRAKALGTPPSTAARGSSETDARDDTSGGRPKRVQKKPQETQKQRLERFKREALSTMAAYEDSFPLGHYFMWAIVTVGGKRKYRICIGSGRSSRMEDARAAVAAMPGVDHAWYNLD